MRAVASCREISSPSQLTDHRAVRLQCTRPGAPACYIRSASRSRAAGLAPRAVFCRCQLAQCLVAPLGRCHTTRPHLVHWTATVPAMRGCQCSHSQTQPVLPRRHLCTTADTSIAETSKSRPAPAPYGHAPPRPTSTHAPRTTPGFPGQHAAAHGHHLPRAAKLVRTDLYRAGSGMFLTEACRQAEIDPTNPEQTHARPDGGTVAASLHDSVPP